MPITRRAFLKGTLATTFGFSATGAGTLYYAHNIEPTWFDITHQQFILPRLSKAFHGYRVIQVTDIHADDTFIVAGRKDSILLATCCFTPIVDSACYHPNFASLVGQR